MNPDYDNLDIDSLRDSLATMFDSIDWSDTPAMPAPAPTVVEQVAQAWTPPVPPLFDCDYCDEQHHSGHTCEHKPVPERNATFTNIAELDPEQAKWLRMAQVMGKFASTLTLRPINLEVLKGNWEDPDAPAWSDADNIWIRQDKVGKLDDPESVTSLKGLNLHEISHILLTPRTGSKLFKEVRKAKVFSAFNALEDQRIEMMMTKRFGNVADWLTATIAQHIIAEPKQHSVAFPLIHGRKYLPQQLRSQLTSMYENQNDVKAIASLIDRYIVLNLADPKNYDEAFKIICEYHELVMNLPSDPNKPHWDPQGQPGWGRIQDPNGHHKRKHGEWKPSASKVMSKAEQDKLAKRIADDLAKQQAQQGQGEGDKPGDQGDQGDTPGGNGASESGTPTDVSDVAQKIMDDILKRKAKEIRNSIKQFQGDVGLESKHIASPGKARSKLHAVSSASIAGSKSFGSELVRLKAEHEPGWNRKVDTGHLNAHAYLMGEELDECFDEWDIGREDAVDIECVILLDVSPSMGDVLTGAYESMWAIKRALDKVGAATTVLNFSDTFETLYDSNERALGARMKHAGMGGGTAPHKALEYTKYIMANSDRAIKIVIPITDGEWSNSDACDTVLRELRRGGVLTALAYIETWGYRGSDVTINSHGCEVAVDISHPRDLFTLARRMVKVGIQRNLVTQ